MASSEHHIQNLSGALENIPSSGFQYRGRLFSAGRQKKSRETIISPISSKLNEDKLKNLERSIENLSDAQISQDPQSASNKTRKARKIQSATGRLERNKGIKELCCSSSPFIETAQGTVKNKPSIINLNTVTDVPDHEEEMLSRIITMQEHSNKNKDKPLATCIRPSSAKASIASPVVAIKESPSMPEPMEKIKPSVFGLKLGRQVFGESPKLIEAWKQSDSNYPYRLSTDNAHDNSLELALDERKMPSTMHPLRAWLQDFVPSHIIGLDPSSCLTFLSYNYQDIELPEVPPPQSSMDYLPYTCAVETPRQHVARRYSHPFFDKDFSHETWKCKHNDKFESSGALYSFQQPSGQRTSEKIRKEITELEDLLNGIGSLTSNCSFVQFQAEIDRAKALATKLCLLKPRESEEEKDTFGLLKLYRDHEKIIAELHQRRNECLHELSLLDINANCD